MKKFTSFLFALFVGMSVFAQGNLVTNGDFQNGTDGWELTYQKPADQNVYAITTNEGLQVAQTTAAAGRLDISQDIAVERKAEYILSFEYKATHKKFRIWSFLVSNNDAWVYFTDDAKTDSLRTYNDYFAVADGWTKLSYPFSVPDVDTIPTFRLMFRVYKQANCVANLRNVQVIKQVDDVVTGIENTKAVRRSEKYIKDGRLYFRHEDNVYDIFGTVVE